MFVTQPAKSIQNPFFVKGATSLIDNNDPYLVVENHVAANPETITSVVTTGTTILRNLPFLSASAFANNAVVSHVNLDDGDFAPVTALRDLKFTVLVSQTAQDSARNANIAYRLAHVNRTSVFHFFSPTLYGETEYKPEEPPKVELENTEQVFAYFNTSKFIAANKVRRKDAILYLGQLSDDLVKAATKAKALLITPTVYQPFDLKALLTIIPATVETISIVEQTNTSRSSFSPLLLDFFQEYSKLQSLKNFTKIVSASFGPRDPAGAITALLDNVHSEKPKQNEFYGERTTVDTSAHKSAVESALKLEDAYLKVLKQVNPVNLSVLNEYSSADTNSSNPEFGYGSFLHDIEQSRRLVELVSTAVQQRNNKDELVSVLTRWLVNKRDNGVVDPALSAEAEAAVDKYGAELGEIVSLKKYLHTTSSWLVGSDAWSYDLGSSGVHNVISSGQNINMLIIDSEPHEEKRQTENLRKKDVGLYAMNYGGVYVASVAIYSSYTQVLQALIEAEKFNGPSVVLAYLPYHSEADSTLDILLETKRAVDLGYWPLYRFDPSADSFKLDSSNLRKQLQDFLDRENKLSLLLRKNPVLARNLARTANTESKERQATIADESFAKLLLGLSGPPLTVAFASDGGNAEGLAKKINRQALARGLKSVVMSMDELLLDDLPRETNVIFVASTSGQGEFPTNGKQFWDSLKLSNDLDLSAVKVSVFGLGDSQYWPRKEDKHYYNKPSKDLYARLQLYGATELAPLGLGDDQDADGFSTGFNEWIPQIWKALGVDNVDGVEEPKPLTNEDMKIGSDYLRGTIAEGLRDESTGAICAVDQQLTKFHGIYMQDDRDIREQRKADGLEPAYAFMVRLRLPGGRATPDQYLKLDELSDERGNGTIKVTTRATFQLHGVVKHDLKPAIRGMNAALLDTLAACGDVNRNVMVLALPGNAKVHGQVAETGTLISEHLLPQTTAYHEIWLEGPDEGDKPGDSENWAKRVGGPRTKKTLVSGNALVDVEPLYGVTYLPRKFKIVITVPPYNDVDVYAHDIGLITIVDENDNVVGYNMVIGGGMGTTHNNKKTYPRTASMMGFVPKDVVHIVCEKVMLVQRDFGDRTNRKHARLKYTVDDLGVDVFKGKVEELWGEKFGEPAPFKIESNVDYFGWTKDELGLNHFTAFIENGRIEDTPDLPQKTGLREIARYLRDNNKMGEFRLTGNQHLLVLNIEDADLQHIKDLLLKYKLSNTEFSGLRLSSAACVAFPTCGLAMAELERYLPQLITKLEEALEEYGLRHDSVVMRMTGCPNGCARPWVAEVALVGKALGAYNLMLGGGHHGERLNKIYRYSIKEDEILATLKPLFKRWSLERHEGEPFGDFVIRAGVIKPTLEGKYFHDDIPEDA